MPVIIDKPLVMAKCESLPDLLKSMDMTPAIQSFLTPNATLQTMLQSLCNHGHHFEAATILAHALPKREAIWWASLVARDHALRNGATTEAEDRVVVAAQHWVNQPDEPARVAAHRSALLAGNRVPAYWLGMAVFWSMGNITPDSGVVTPPPPQLYARAVAAVMDMAASLGGVAGREATYELSLSRGIHIAAGGNGELV